MRDPLRRPSVAEVQLDELFTHSPAGDMQRQLRVVSPVARKRAWEEAVRVLRQRGEGQIPVTLPPDLAERAAAVLAVLASVDDSDLHGKWRIHFHGTELWVSSMLVLTRVFFSLSLSLSRYLSPPIYLILI